MSDVVSLDNEERRLCNKSATWALVGATFHGFVALSLVSEELLDPLSWLLAAPVFAFGGLLAHAGLELRALAKPDSQLDLDGFGRALGRWLLPRAMLVIIPLVFALVVLVWLAIDSDSLIQPLLDALIEAATGDMGVDLEDMSIDP